MAVEREEQFVEMADCLHHNSSVGVHAHHNHDCLDHSHFVPLLCVWRVERVPSTL